MASRNVRMEDLRKEEMDIMGRIVRVRRVVLYHLRTM